MNRHDIVSTCLADACSGYPQPLTELLEHLLTEKRINPVRLSFIAERRFGLPPLVFAGLLGELHPESIN